MKKCPPGKICFEPLMLLLIFLILVMIYFYFSKSNIFENDNTKKLYSELDILKKKTNNLESINDKLENINSKLKKNKTIEVDYQLPFKNTYIFDKNYDRLVNPLRPPLKSPSYTSAYSINFDDVGIPINIPTRGLSPEFQQIGLLYRKQDKDNVLPLFGKKLYNGSSKWWYYTIANQYNSVKIPIKFKDRDCQGDFGCDELSDNDEVFIPIYNNAFKVKIYQNDNLRYIPY